jgi:hypothetical protein
MDCDFIVQTMNCSTWSRFHQHIIYVQLLRARSDPKRAKKNSQAISLFCAFGICKSKVKAAHKYVDEIDPLGMKNCAGYAQWVKTNCFVYLI